VTIVVRVSCEKAEGTRHVVASRDTANAAGHNNEVKRRCRGACIHLMCIKVGEDDRGVGIRETIHSILPKLHNN
jgi:hypothetical protein